MREVILIPKDELNERLENIYKEIFPSFFNNGIPCKYKEDEGLDFNDPVVFRKVLNRALEKSGFLKYKDIRDL